MTRLRISLVFGASAGTGGSERRMIEMVRELRSIGVAVRSFAPGRRTDTLNAQLELAGAQVTVFHNPLEMVRVVSRSPANATWAFGARAAFPLLAARRSWIWSAGELWIAQNGLDALRARHHIAVERLLMRSADMVIANSAASADHSVKRTRVSANRVRLVRSALSDEWQSPPTREAREHVRIAMVGNSRPEKQHKLGVQLFARLSDPDTTLDIYTNDGGQVNDAIRGLPVSTSGLVTVHEGENVTPETMRKADILLHPSSSESMPRVALEARSQGAWVVGFDVGDLSQWCNATVPLGDERGLLIALRRACDDVRNGMVPPAIRPISTREYCGTIVTLLMATNRPQGQEE